MELESWFKLKKYPHIGYPLTVKDYEWVKTYVSDPLKIKVHSFLPFIHKSYSKRRFRADIDNPERSKKGERKRKKYKNKEREIYYASHLDSIIYSYYSSELSERYEEFISHKKFNDSIVAYRKIPIFKGSESYKCNIEFAKDAFEFIAQNKKNLTVIVADVTSFFDNINHKLLKRQWARVLDEKSLPEDHYNVFKSLTKIKYIEGSQLFKSYDKTMIVEKGIPNSEKTQRVRKRIVKEAFFKEKKR